MTCPTAAHYSIHDSRSTSAAESVMKDYVGVAMCDGYDVYEALVKRCGGRFVTAHCWSHVRRKFIECERASPTQSAQIVALIAELYAIEKRAPPGPAGDEERGRLRDTESRAVVKKSNPSAKSV